MRGPLAAVVAAAVLAAACSGSKPASTTTPTGPTAPTPAPGAAPVPKFTVQVDDGHVRDAITLLSDVVADASASTGSSALTFSIDFGDGTTATTAAAHHTYGVPGAFTVTVTVTDAAGQKATASQHVTVRNMLGAWYQAGYAPRSFKVEVRRLSIDVQSGLNVVGTMSINNLAHPVTGTLTRPRHLHLMVDYGAALDGDVPSQLGDDAQAFTFADQGDSIDGPVTFQPILGTPSGPAPVASLTMTWGGGLPAPIAGATPVNFDASASRGADLSYFLEFGDGTVATASQASHVADVSNPNTYSLTARVTVVDRFGRSDSRSSDYFLYDMGVRELDSWYDGPTNGSYTLFMAFRSRSGANYTGSIMQRGEGPPGSALSATVSGDGSAIVIRVPASGVEYLGTIQSVNSVWQLVLVQHGGASDGATWRLPVHGYS
jgi:hypothetical protein